MRVLLLAGAALCLAACAKTMTMDTPLGRQAAPEWPFPVERGSALPPPDAQAAAAAPPEGAAPGGFDFGPWRSADEAGYRAAFQDRIRARLAGKSRAEVHTDLAANGFACGDTGRALDCRIEIVERGCARDWYVVVEPGAAEPVAGYDVLCSAPR